MTKYARDEFDQVPQNTSRQGVHRDSQDATRPTLWPVLTVGAVALVLGLVAFLILPNLGIVAPSASSSVTTPAPQQTSTSPSAAPSASSSAPPASNEPSTEPTPSTTPSPSTAPVDKSVPVAVYNGTGTAGLAGRVAGLVQGGGWTLSTVANWGGLPQQTSVIFYNAPTQKANAEALGALLGIQSIVETPDVQQPLVVVAGPGYQ